MASVVSTMTARPGEGVQAMNAVMRDTRVQRLWTDTVLRGSLARGDEGALAGSSTVRALAGDQVFLAAARQLGVLPVGAGGEQLAAQLASQVGPLVRSIASIQDDPEIRRTMNDPELRRLVERGDFAALASDPRFNQLAGRIMERLRGTGGATPVR
jgi:hypothetical protein